MLSYAPTCGTGRSARVPPSLPLARLPSMSWGGSDEHGSARNSTTPRASVYYATRSLGSGFGFGGIVAVGVAHQFRTCFWPRVAP